MATKDKYEFFNQRFIEEAERQRDLLKKSQLYFSVITIVSSILFANIIDYKLLVTNNQSLKIYTVVLLVDLAVILLFLFFSIRVQNYIQAISTEDYLENLGDKEETDKDFFDNRIADFIASIDRNKYINNKKAEFLKYSEYAILVFILLILLITLQIFI